MEISFDQIMHNIKLDCRYIFLKLNHTYMLWVVIVLMFFSNACVPVFLQNLPGWKSAREGAESGGTGCKVHTIMCWLKTHKWVTWVNTPTYRGYFSPFITVSGAHLVDLGKRFHDQTANFNTSQFSVKQPGCWILLKMIPLSLRNTKR